MNYLIIGGTGTLGTELIKQLLNDQFTRKITIFSRCELKQKIVKSRFRNNLNKLDFIIGDIRDLQALKYAFCRAEPHTVFHVAALKHIDAMEDNPEESVKTNIIGTINVADAAYEYGYCKVLFSTTDKAVDPINTYGMSKGISEKILLQRNKNRNSKDPIFLIYRWGNVLGSRGSILEILEERVSKKMPFSITHWDMTRYWINIEDAVKFMLETHEQATGEDVLIPGNIKAASMKNFISAYLRVRGINEDYPCDIVGPRAGEKFHEALVSLHEKGKLHTSYCSPQFTIDELEVVIKRALK